MAEETVRQPDEVEAQFGDKKLRIRGSDILGMINMLAIGVMLYGGWAHVDAAKDGSKDIAQAIKESVNTQRQMVQAQQEANCLLDPAINLVVKHGSGLCRLEVLSTKPMGICIVAASIWAFEFDYEFA